MKKILLLFLVSSQVLLAQIPQAFNYQGIARDLSGNPLANKAIKVRLSILSESGTNQTTIYSESHNLSTNQFGLFALPVGKGTVISGTFAGIIWTDATKKLLKSEIDPDGNGYSLNVTSDLQSVPFALSAKTVETENQKLTLAGNLLSISQGNSVDLSALVGNNSQWTNTSYGIDYSGGKVSIGNDNVGVAPGAYWFHLKKKAVGAERYMMLVENTSNTADALAGCDLKAGTEANQSYMNLTSFAKSYFPNLPTSGLGALISEKVGIIASAQVESESRISFFTGGTLSSLIERMRLDYLGNLGIGTSNPTQKLDVAGKVRIQDLPLNSTSSKILVADATGVIGYKDATTFGNGSSQWINDGNKIYYSLGDVIIGNQAISTPSFAYKRLHINSEITNPTQWDSQVGITSETPGGITRVNFVSNLNSVNAQIESGREVNDALNSNGYLSLKTRSSANGVAGFMQEIVRLTSTGYVGIGTISPAQKLDVNGKVRIQDLGLMDASRKVVVADASGTLGYTDIANLGTGPWTKLADGINYNSGRVLVGDPTASHIASLIISKNAIQTERNFIVTHNTSNANDANNGNYFFAGTGSNLAGLDITVNAKSYFPNLGTSGYASVRSEKLALTAASNNSSDAFIAFITGGDNITNPNGGIERMRITKLGTIGIGTNDPKTQLHVKGAVYLEDANQGMIMKSPNGQCWKVTVGDTGTLTSTSVTCP